MVLRKIEGDDGSGASFGFGPFRMEKETKPKTGDTQTKTKAGAHGKGSNKYISTHQQRREKFLVVVVGDDPGIRTSRKS